MTRRLPIRIHRFTPRRRSRGSGECGSLDLLGILVLLLVSAADAGCATALGARGEEEGPEAATHSFAVYALSRGGGVPEPTRDALRTVRRMLEDAQREGATVRVEESRIGLEGERRLCADFGDAKIARETLERIRVAVKDVELLNLVEEPCSMNRGESLE